METVNKKRARLRLELQDAYDAWMAISEFWARRVTAQPLVDLSGSPKETQPEWFEYLAAKRRLVVAYAER